MSIGMFYVYVLQSEGSGRHYIGFSSNVSQRLKTHNAGNVRSTKAYTPYRLIYSETYATKTQALKREKELKAMHGNKAFRTLIEE